MRIPNSFLKWVASLFQNFGVGFFMLGLGTLLFQESVNGVVPEFSGSLFMALSWVLIIASALVEAWLVIRDKGK
ncbi:hypothetical protein DET61_11656 [Marinobacter nauticus]|jgi:hypothetical protein|uniref:Uncharacterized protein n=1 Tax=Marinobacter nauticus TaxID=2743 RepID=A0A368X862_MARNT|nr:hypothetical protein [Marinobacter nauticus]RCW64015.1 hypothetical protein DET61_11656 [Marinobacter nauticus]